MKTILIITFISIILIQFIKSNQINPVNNTEYEITAPTKIMSILKRSCYDCHSNNTIWPWYSNIAPLSWTITNHVNQGRQVKNC